MTISSFFSFSLCHFLFFYFWTKQSADCTRMKMLVFCIDSFSNFFYFFVFSFCRYFHSLLPHILHFATVHILRSDQQTKRFCNSRCTNSENHQLQFAVLWIAIESIYSNSGKPTIFLSVFRFLFADRLRISVLCLLRFSNTSPINARLFPTSHSNHCLLLFLLSEDSNLRNSHSLMSATAEHRFFYRLLIVLQPIAHSISTQSHAIAENELCSTANTVFFGFPQIAHSTNRPKFPNHFAIFADTHFASAHFLWLGIFRVSEFETVPKSCSSIERC